MHVKAFYDSNNDGTGDFNGLAQKLDYLKELGITTIWLLPFFPSPMKDDGYDIADYFSIHPQYGSLNDFKKFLREAHKRGIRVIVELVLNHTSDQHPWFQRSRSKPNTVWRDFYVWSDTPERYRDARIIFKDFETSNWAWDPVAKKYYWHRFYSHQPDLNYDNQEVQKKMIEIASFWLEMGVDGLRLDAVPYLFEREGTNCENLPETHAFLKKLRAAIDSKFRDKMLLAEANQWPIDAVAYFGQDDECHMAFHFPLMPRMFMALDLEDRFPIVETIDSTPEIPAKSQWAIFLRNHDELTLEMVTDEERDYMYRSYARDRRARVNLGIRRRLAPLLGNDRRRIELLNVLLMTLPGTPVLYYGDEIGMGDNYYLGDRNGVRTPMQWSADLNAGFSKANPQKLYLPVVIDPEYHYENINVENQIKNQTSLFWFMKKLIAVRKRFKAFGRGTIEPLSPENNKILAFTREYGEELVLVAANLSKHPQAAELDLSKYESLIPHEIFGWMPFPKINKGGYMLTFPPYGYYVFSLAKSPIRSVAPIVKPEMRLKNANELFAPKGLEQLEYGALPVFIRSSRWFGGKAREIDQIKVREVCPLKEDEPAAMNILIVDVYYVEGKPETYVVPTAYSKKEHAQEILEKHRDQILAKVFIDQEERVLYDGVLSPEFRKNLLSLISRRRVVKGRHGDLRGVPRERLKTLQEDPESMPSRVMGVEQSNTSIVYQDKVILKLFRRIDEGINPDLEMSSFLTEKGFRNSPRLMGEIGYHESGADVVAIATLSAFIRNQGDAWKLCLEEAKAFYERVLLQKGKLPEPDVPNPILIKDRPEAIDSLRPIIGERFLKLVALLAVRTGEMHKILLSETNNPDFTPEPFNYLYQLALSQSMVSYANRIFMMAEKHMPEREDVRKGLGEILSNKAAIIDQFKSIRRMKIDALKIRVHGDYHLGQVLFDGNDFYIIDFEGEPARPMSERRIKRSPLRDVTGMIRSFHYVAYNALYSMPTTDGDDLGYLEGWAEAWYRVCAATYLSFYIDSVAGTRLIPADEESLRLLLKSFLLEKAVYELGYELNNRPDWVMIPIKGIKSLLETTS